MIIGPYVLRNSRCHVKFSPPPVKIRRHSKCGQIGTRVWANSYHIGTQSDIQSLIWKAANSSCWWRTQHNGSDSISVGRMYIPPVGDSISFILSPGETLLSPRGDFLWGGSITQHRRYGRQAKLPTSRHSLYRRRLAASMPRSAAVLCAHITQLPTAYIGVSLQCVGLAGEGIQAYEINNFVPAPCRKFNTSTGRKHARFNTLRCLLRRYTTVCEPGHTLESYEKHGWYDRQLSMTPTNIWISVISDRRTSYQLNSSLKICFLTSYVTTTINRDKKRLIGISAVFLVQLDLFFKFGKEVQTELVDGRSALTTLATIDAPRLDRHVMHMHSPHAQQCGLLQVRRP